MRIAHLALATACALALAACSDKSVGVSALSTDVAVPAADTDALADSDVGDTQHDETGADSPLPNDVDAFVLLDAANTADALVPLDGADTSDAPEPPDANPYAGAAGKAPDIAVGDWPPPCDQPHTFGDSKKGDATKCWQPPDSWCAVPASLTLDPACSPDGKYCCVFSVFCKPCDWVSCFGCPESPSCPPQCLGQPEAISEDSPWFTPECVQFNKILTSTDCALCGSDVYCKP